MADFKNRPRSTNIEDRSDQPPREGFQMPTLDVLLGGMADFAAASIANATGGSARTTLQYRTGFDGLTDEEAAYKPPVGGLSVPTGPHFFREETVYSLDPDKVMQEETVLVRDRAREQEYYAEHPEYHEEPGPYLVPAPASWGLMSVPAEGLSQADRDKLIYTILGEARGEGVPGMVGVANVIRNRADEGGLFPSNPVDVVLQPWQFSTNNSAANGGNQDTTRAQVPVGSDLYNQASRIVDLYVLGDTPPTDLTGGSLYYHINGLAWPYADAVTTGYGTTQIGGHTFYPRQPLPQIDIGSVDLLGGGMRAAAPIPRSRGERPGGYTQTSAQRIAEIRTETRFQQQQAAAATVMRQTMAQAAFGSISEAALSVTPRAPNVDFTTQFEVSPEEVATLARPVPMDVSQAEARETVFTGGLGSLLGRAFPMGPTAVDNPVTQRPTIAERIGGPAPGLRLLVTPETREPLVPYSPSSLRPGDTVADSGLIRRSVQTIAIDPMTGMPRITSPAPRLDQADAPPWTSMGASPYMTMEERARLAVDMRPLMNPASPSAPGAGLTPAQRAAISGSGAPVPLPANARDMIAPIPMPASARPQTVTRTPLPVPAPLTFPSSSTVPAPVQRTVAQMFNNQPAPGLRLPTSPVASSTPTPVAPIARPVTQTVTRTVIVRTDGTTVAVPRAGSVQMPADARPSAIPPVTGLTPQQVSTSTVAPQQPTVTAQLSAPGAGLTAAQRAAISGSGAPTPAVLSPGVRAPVAAAPAPTVAPRTVVSTRAVTVAQPARIAPSAMGVSSSSGGPRSSTIIPDYGALPGEVTVGMQPGDRVYDADTNTWGVRV